MKLLFAIFFFFATLNLFSQNYTHLYIIDSLTQKPIEEAKITELGTQKVYYSGFNGRVDVPQKTIGVFRIEHINYKTKTVKLNLKEKEINVFIAQKSHSLNQIVVSAKMPKNSYPAGIQIMSSENINKFINLNTSTDFFKYSANISSLNPLGIFNHSQRVSFIGSGEESGRTLFLFDGVPLNKADDGNVNWNMLPSGMIDKVIISKNPNSSFFGNNSMIGMVNFVSSEKKESGFSMKTKIDYGTYNTASLEIMPSYRHKTERGLFFDIDAFGRRSDGFVSTVDSLQMSDVNYLPTKLWEYKANLVLGYDFNRNNTLKIMTNVFDDFRGLEIQINEPQGTYAKHTAYLANINYQSKFQKATLGFNASYYYEHYFKNIESLKKGDYSLIYVNSIRRDFNSSVYMNSNITRFYLLSGGINLHLGDVYGVDDYQTSTDKVINSGQIITDELFINNQFKFLSKQNLILNIGGNLNLSKVTKPSFLIQNPTSATDFMTDYTGEFDGNTLKNNSFGANLTYNIKNNFFIWTGVNKGYFNPTLEDLTRSGFMRLGFKLANPQLKPETTMKYFTGISFIKKQITAKFNASYLNGKNYMVYVETGESLFGGRKKIVQKRNIAAVNIINSTVELEYNSRKYGMFANYSYNYSVVNSLDSAFVDHQLAYTPNHNAHLGFWVDIQNITLALASNYSSEQFLNIENTEKISAFTTFDAKLTVHLNEKFEMNMSIDNFFNYTYLINYDQQSLGRFINFSIEYNF